MNLLERRYNGKCSISELTMTTNPSTNVTSPTWAVVANNMPCRVVVDTSTTVSNTNGAPAISQTVTLLIEPTILVRPGSRVTVEHDGRTDYFKAAGMASVYLFHQEVPLINSEEWA